MPAATQASSPTLPIPEAQLRVVIADDEELARQRIRDFLDQRRDVRVAAECRNGRETVEAIRRHEPDLVFLDVQMPDLDGFGVIDEIGAEQMPPVVFVTAFDAYAVDAFEANAVDYLLKPFGRDRLEQAVDRTLERLGGRRLANLDRSLHRLLEKAKHRRRYPDRLIVRSSGSVYLVKVDSIDWVEAARNYVRIHCGTELHTMRDTMSKMEQRLDPEKFLRIHRSTMVNIDRIHKIEPGLGTEAIVELDSGQRLIVSRAYRRGRVKELLDAF